MQTLVEIGPGRFAHCSGALWIPDLRTTLIADLHLGYAWAQRRRGEMGPTVEGGIRRKLELLIDDLQPEHLVVLGDLVHAPRPSPAERAIIEDTIRSLQTRTHVILVPGNHDRGFMRDFPGLVTINEVWTGAGVIAIHGHRTGECPTEHVVLGHIHPAMGVFDDAGAHQKIPVFIAGSTATVLPAFSPFASGTTLGQAITPNLKKLLGARTKIYAATGRRVVHVPRAVR